MHREVEDIYLILPVIVTIIAFAMVVMFIVFNNRKNNLLKKKYEDEIAFQKKLHRIELDALRSQLNPHFIHNSLNAIQYYIQRNEVEISENYLTKFSKLMRLFFEYSKRPSITISEEVFLLKTYLEIEKLRFEEKVDYKIHIDKKLDAESIEVPTMIVQPIVENAINHGLFHKKGKGTVEVSFKYMDQNSYKIVVKDDGVGIKKTLAMKAKSVNRLNSSKIIEERLLLLKKSEQVHIEHSIVDLSENGDSTGTEVTLIITQNNEL